MPWPLPARPIDAALILLLAAAGLPAMAERFDCVIEPGRVVRVGGAIPGILAEVSVERGQHVTMGETLARLETRVEEATIALLEQRASDTASVEARAARARLADARMKRAETLLGRKAIAVDAYEEIKAEQQIAAAELVVARNENRRAQLELERAKAQLDLLTLRSPIDGVVTQRLLDVGEYVFQDREVVEISALDPLHVEVYLPADLYPSIREGMEATVQPDLPGIGPRRARVQVVDSVFEATSNSFGVRLVLDNPDKALPGALRCTVEFPPG